VFNATILGIEIGIPLQLVAWPLTANLFFGGFRIKRRCSQILVAQQDPYVTKTPLQWGWEVCLGLIPAGGKLEAFR
jgi:hypothetical protein